MHPCSCKYTMSCLKITDEKWSKLKMCIDFITGPYPYSFSYHSHGQLRNSKERLRKKKKRTRLHKRITLPRNIWTKDIALQCSVVSKLVNQSNTMSFHTIIVFFINQQTLYSDCARCQTEVIVLSLRPAMQLSAGLLQLGDCPLPLHYPKHCFSPAL